MKGLSALLDLYGCDMQALRSMEVFYRTLARIAKVVGFTPLSFPEVVVVEDKDDCTKWGLSGHLLFAESHVTLHSWPELQYLMCDLTGCKEFPIDKLREELELAFNPQKDELKVCLRMRELRENADL